MVKILDITSDACKERMIAYMRENVGFKKKWSVESFGEMCWIEERSIESYMGGYALPPLPKLLRILFFFGPRFVNGFLRMIGMDGARRIAVEAVTDAQLNRAAAEIVGTLARIYEDGVKDHGETFVLFQTVSKEFEVIQDWLFQNDPRAAKADTAASATFLETRNSSGGFDA